MLLTAFSHCVALFWAPGRTCGGCGPLHAAGCQPDRAQGPLACGAWSSAPPSTGDCRDLAGRVPGYQAGRRLLTSTGCWFRPAPRMPLCAAPVGCFVALWYRVRLLIWPRANPSRMARRGRSATGHKGRLRRAREAGDKAHAAARRPQQGSD